jgi:tRNA(adenine34) deaminase
MKSTAQRKTSKHSKTSKHKWSAGVKTDSTFPPAGTFTKPGDEVARIMATRKVSPRGLGSAIKMVQMFINRSGINLSAARKRELEKAKQILQHKLHAKSVAK